MIDIRFWCNFPGPLRSVGDHTRAIDITRVETRFVTS